NAHPDFEVTAVCDINEERLRKYSKKYSISKTYTDYRELLENDEIDAVSITTWNNLHAPIAIAALRAGKNVLCEKPLALNAIEAQEMVDTAQQTGKLLMVGFVRRFGENAKYIKKLIEQGNLGNVYYAKTGVIRRWGNPGGWFSDKKRSGGGPVIDLGVHMIDLVRYVVGKPKVVSVTASTYKHLGMKPGIKGIEKYYSADYSEYNDVEDAATAMIKFDNDMTLFFETSWVMHTKEDELYLSLYGDKAGAKVEPDIELYTENNSYFNNTRPIIDKEKFGFVHNFRQEISHFVNCVQGKTECINPGEDGLELMRIIDAIYKSSKTGHEIILNN
ncbi:MAG: Gfo/Idh/MocA family protein, partial [Nanoarchaeota archaeon]